MKLVTQFQRFRNEFSPSLFRELVRQLEQLFARIDVDVTKQETSVTSTTYTAAREDSLLLCDTSLNNITITFDTLTDEMIRGRYEIEVVKLVAANILTIVPTGTDPILGDTSVVLTVATTAIRFRATTQGWVAI